MELAEIRHLKKSRLCRLGISFFSFVPMKKLSQFILERLCLGLERCRSSMIWGCTTRERSHSEVSRFTFHQSVYVCVLANSCLSLFNTSRNKAPGKHRRQEAEWLQCTYSVTGKLLSHSMQSYSEFANIIWVWQYTRAQSRS